MELHASVIIQINAHRLYTDSGNLNMGGEERDIANVAEVLLFQRLRDI